LQLKQITNQLYEIEERYSKVNHLRQVLEEDIVSGNIVKIDNKYYDASQVVHFLPKTTNIEVEFSVDNNNQLTYIKPTGIQKTSKPFTPKKISRQPKQPSDRSEKIAKQLLLKIADNKTNLDKTYQKLKEKYLDELK